LRNRRLAGSKIISSFVKGQKVFRNQSTNTPFGSV